MTRAKRIGIVAGVLVVVMIVGWALAITAASAAVRAAGGMMTVEIEDREDGFDLYLPVPMVLVDLAARIALGSAESAVYTVGVGRAGAAHPAHVEELGVDFGQLGPVLRGLLAGLEELPDVTLVEVIDGDTRVRVAKSGGKLVVEIDEPATSIKLGVPARGAVRVAERLLR